MYEDYTFDNILSRMLSRVPGTIDKRTGSVIYNALAPAAAELAQAYIDLELVENRTYADTADGEDLIRRAAERGINIELPTKAIRKGVFKGSGNIPFNPPAGSRFSAEGLNYTVKEKISEGEFQLECETAGEAGNT